MTTAQIHLRRSADTQLKSTWRLERRLNQRTRCFYIGHAINRPNIGDSIIRTISGNIAVLPDGSYRRIGADQ